MGLSHRLNWCSSPIIERWIYMYKSMEEKINQNYESAEFCEINGRILRSLNVLNDKKPKLNSFITLFSDVDFNNFSDCIEYLSLSGYVKTIDIFTNKEKVFSIKDFNETAVTLTVDGIRLLKGKTEDKAVNV